MHCLNLKITYNCTNDCSFCFSSYLKDNVMSLAGMKNAVKQGRKNGCNELVISGGEPTTIPDTIIDLMGLAEQLGYEKYIIQTNGSGLAENYKLVDFLNSIAQNKEVCISFSVHGHTAEIHDKMSRREGAFDSIIKGIKNISETKCNIYTNTVISSMNVGTLSEIAKVIMPYKPVVMQFSMMHLATSTELSVSLKDSVCAVHRIRNLVDLKILKTEGIPYCLMYGMEECVGESCWPSTLDIYNKDNKYMNNFKQVDYGMRRKSAFCEKCIMNKICMGVWAEHYEEFYNLGINPIK